MLPILQAWPRLARPLPWPSCHAKLSSKLNAWLSSKTAKIDSDFCSRGVHSAGAASVVAQNWSKHSEYSRYMACYARSPRINVHRHRIEGVATICPTDK